MSRRRQLTHIGDTALTDRNWSTDLAQLDIALSSLRDAMRGSGTKDFTTLETLLATALARNLTKWGGATLTGRDISSDLQVLSDLKKGAQNADAVSAETSNTLKTIALLQALDQNGALARLIVESATNKNLRAALYEGANQIAKGATPAESLSNPSTILQELSFPLRFNGSAWDRAWNNVIENTLLAPAARTVYTSSAAQVNYNHRGVFVVLNVTSVPGGDTINLRIEALHTGLTQATGLLQGANISGAGVYRYLLYPGIGAASVDITGVESRVLPRDWRVAITPSASSSFTYAVYAYTIV